LKPSLLISGGRAFTRKSKQGVDFMDENKKTVEMKFLTVEEFAKRIGVHPQTVRQWDNNGVLPAHHKTPSGRRCYTEEQVNDYFKIK
jgi:excisionase family DNA binding protein